MLNAGVICSSRKTVASPPAPSGGGWPDITAPSGSASLSGGNAPAWVPDASASGYLIYLSTSSQALPDTSLYSYRYFIDGQAASTITISGIAAGTYYYRVAPLQYNTIGDLGFEIQVTAS